MDEGNYDYLEEERVASETGADDFDRGDYMNTNGAIGNGDSHSTAYKIPEDNKATGWASETHAEVVHTDAVILSEITPQSRCQSQDVLVDTSLDEELPNQSMYFTESDEPLRIDFVLVYDLAVPDAQKEKLRKQFEENLADVGVMVERELSSDGKAGCVKIHSPWDALAKGAKLLGMKKRITVNKDMESAFYQLGCLKVISPDQKIVPDEEEFFTAPFDPDKLHHFAIENREEFFTNAERSLITKMFIDNIDFTDSGDGGVLSSQAIYKGIDTLLSKKAYTAAFPLHEGQIKQNSGDPDFFNGQDKDRLRLYYGWAKPSNICRFQPLDHIRNYFGEKIGLYFAWLGFYTIMLIPAAMFGLGVFLYGLITLRGDIPSNDVCNRAGPGNYTICPLCDKQCDYTTLASSCVYARLTYIFDNYATVALAIFMSAWALIFLEFWKREQSALQFMWDIGDYEAVEKYRPGYEKNAKKFKINPVTEKPEPYIPWYDKFARLFTSVSLIFFLVVVVVAAIFAVLIYRMAVAAALFALDSDGSVGKAVKENAKLITTVTSSIINLVVITILSLVYKWLALFCTKLEKHKTFTDHEDSYTFKMIVFQFINYYGSIIYIAFFKGSFVDPPGRSTMYVFGKYRQDQCDPTGCFIELTIQLGIIMVGKQAISAVVELIIPFIKNRIRQINDDMKNRKRWEDDLDLEEHSPFLMFDEYLEMVIQFGFVTLFVTAFPLGPLFALINNAIEIRLDAHKALKLFRRPVALKAQDIGAWYPILRGLAYIAVITNAFIIAWTSEFIPKMVYQWNRWNRGEDLSGYIDASLSSINTLILNVTKQMPDPVIFHDSINVTECRFRGYYQLMNTSNEYPNTTTEYPNYELKPVYWQIFFARMVFVIVFEHTCFLLMSLVAIMVPDVSARIRRMRRYERQLVDRRDFEDTFTSVRDKRLTLATMFGNGRVTQM